jgi:hypothetical protein
LQDTYIVGDGSVILSLERRVRGPALQREHQTGVLRVDELRKGWEAEEDGKKGEDAHVD